MNKYFFISNRQSGKTHLAIYEFLKNPEESILVVQNYKQIKDIIDKDLIPDNFIEKIISVGSGNSLRGLKAKRIIFDDYLQIDTIKRSELYIDTSIIDPGKPEAFTLSSNILLV